MQTTPINRTQNWLIAILFTTTLVCVGVVISLLNGKFSPSNATAQTAPINNDIKTAVIPVSQTTNPTVTTGNTLLSEPTIRTTARQLLPAQTIQGVEKVNYEGQIAYQVTTDKAKLYLNAHTGNVMAILPLAPAVQTVQVAYQPETGTGENMGESEHERHEHGERGEHERGEHDDD